MTEKELTIIRGETDTQNPGFAMRRLTMQHRGMSFEARGLLGYLLSKPGDWKVMVEDLQAEGDCGRDRVKRILAELVKLGYMGGHQRQRDPKTKKFFYTPYRVYMNPANNPDYASKQEPVTEKPSTEKPLTENTSVYSSTESDKETENTETTSGASAPVVHEGQSDGVKGETVTDAGKSNGATLALDTIKAGHVVTLKNGKAVLVREVLPDGKFRVGKDLALDIITGDDLALVQNGAAKVDRLEQIPATPPDTKPRKPDALFDALALYLFEIPADEKDKPGGRIGKLKTVCKKHAITPDEIQTFCGWWNAVKQLALPLGQDTFEMHILKWRAEGSPKAPAAETPILQRSTGAATEEQKQSRAAFEQAIKKKMAEKAANDAT